MGVFQMTVYKVKYHRFHLVLRSYNQINKYNVKKEHSWNKFIFKNRLTKNLIPTPPFVFINSFPWTDGQCTHQAQKYRE